MITKEKFLAYETVRMSGMTNMFDRKKIIELAKIQSRINLGVRDIKEIQKYYNRYKRLYLEKKI